MEIVAWVVCLNCLHGYQEVSGAQAQRPPLLMRHHHVGPKQVLVRLLSSHGRNKARTERSMEVCLGVGPAG